MSGPRLLLGDCVERLRDLADESVAAVVCDPPYGLGKEPPIADVLEAWLAGRVYVPTGGGFMGKTWDAFVPDVAVWRECFRVLKPGGYLLAFSGTRTVDLIGIGLRLAGFERRDLIAWLYGSGFPKSLDVSKAIDRAAGAEREVVGYDESRARPNRTGTVLGEVPYDRSDNGATITPATEAAREWEGWGTALKPALEPIVVARKPLAGTVAENVVAHGTGALNVDACRVAFRGAEDEAESKEKNRHGDFGTGQGGNAVYGDFSMLDPRENYDAPGRWPANVLLSHTDDCVPVGERRVAADGHWPVARPAGSELAGASGHVGQDGLDERAANGETVAVWECSADCPIRLLDDQSGLGNAGTAVRRNVGKSGGNFGFGGANATMRDDVGYGDFGGASRFFYCAKTSRAERNAGLVLCSCETSTEWVNEDLRASTPPATDTPPPRGTTASTTPISADTDSRTMSFGSARTEPSPPDSRSITETAISRTTTSETSSSSPTSTTSGDTRLTTEEEPTVDGSGAAPSAISGSQRTPSTTTSRSEDGSPPDAADPATSERSSSRSSSDAGSLWCPSCGGLRGGHPTVKPIDLMRWLVRLVARPGSVVCDPFLGSGTTGVACGLEGVDFVGVEREPEYLAIAEARMRFWAEYGEDALRVVADRDAADRVRRVREDAGQLDLFGQGA